MKMYLFSLLIGIFVGLIYGVLHVRSPAPPLIALIGLLGMLLGEAALPAGQQLIDSYKQKQHSDSFVDKQLPVPKESPHREKN